MPLAVLNGCSDDTDYIAATGMPHEQTISAETLAARAKCGKVRLLRKAVLQGRAKLRKCASDFAR